MATREIPREEWLPFFDAFSVQHDGWLTTVEVKGEEVGGTMELTEMPLVGISYEQKGSEGEAIYIVAGTEPDRHQTHTIRAPRRVYFQQGETGEETLEISSSKDPGVVVRLRAAGLRRAGGR